MKKVNLIRSLGIQGLSLVLMTTLVFGAAYAALGEETLYSEQSLAQETDQSEMTPITATAEPEIEVIEPSATATNLPSATPKPSKTSTTTKTRTKTTVKTLTSSPTQEETKETTTEVCEPPADWIQYQVQPGENLYRISLKFHTTVDELKAANCMGDSIVIVSGELIWVPNIATSTPSASETPEATNTNTPNPTATITLEPTLEESPTPEITQTDTSP